MIISQEQLTQLTRIYNTLLNISTRGEDTIVMGECLKAFRDSLMGIGNSSTQAPIVTDTPSVKQQED